MNGHNISELMECLNFAKNQTTDKPMMIIANTIKGKGVSFIENDPSWHARQLTPGEVLQARIDLENVV